MAGATAHPITEICGYGSRVRGDDNGARIRNQQHPWLNKLISLSLLDLALRAATVALLLVLAAALYRDFRHVVAGRLAVAFALGSAAHAVVLRDRHPAPVSLGAAPLIALSTGNIVVFWLFTRALFDDSFRCAGGT